MGAHCDGGKLRLALLLCCSVCSSVMCERASISTSMPSQLHCWAVLSRAVHSALLYTAVSMGYGAY
jgi:hypothetical protein